MRARRILAAVLLAAFAAPAQAAYPEKPIRFVVPSAPGGSVDVLMRILTQQLSAQMGVAFVVENKPGASFVPGTMDPSWHYLKTKYLSLILCRSPCVCRPHAGSRP
jgi:hypothetical protein